MQADKFFMLEQFRAADEVFYFNACHDITLSGPDYKVKDVRYFILNEGTPLADYIQIKLYDDRFLLVTAHTRNAGLLAEGFACIAELAPDFKEIELRTPFPEILEYDGLTGTFEQNEPSDPASPVYFIHSPVELIAPIPDETVTVSLAAEEDKAEIERENERGNLNPEEIGPYIFNTFTIFKDTRLYILRVGGTIAGYLRAECGFSNIYDIGWLYVRPDYRGHHYAVHLTHFFSADCFAAGRVPHYGFAISDASVRVAEKCGYSCDPAKITRRQLVLRSHPE